MRRLLILLAAPACLAATLTACAGDPGWVNPDLPKKQAAGDYASCRRYADDMLGAYNIDPPGMENDSNPTRMMDRYDNRKQFDALVGACMRSKGYFPKH